MHAQPDHPKVKPARVGILLANLGTPDGTDYWSMRRYLNEFLSDKRVVDYSAWIWQPLLQLIILTKRPFSSGAAYKSIWNEEDNESPLLTITKKQTAAIKAQMVERYGDDVRGRFLHALRQPLDQIESARDGRGRMHQDPVLPALSALRRRNLCHGKRPILPRPDGRKMATDRPRG